MNFKIFDICNINKNNLSIKDDLEFINYLDTSNLTEGIVENLQKLVIGKDKIPNRAKRKVEQNNILISTVRPNQKHYGIIKKKEQNLIASTGFVVLSVKEDMVSSEYLYRFLTQESITEYLQAIAETSTSTYPSIKPSDIGSLDIKLPPLNEQKAIAKILSDLDGKIETNNQINTKLEEMAQAIFDEMFPNVTSGDATIGDYITPKRGKNLLSKDAIFGEVPVVAGGLTPNTYHNVSNTQAPVITISASGANAGFVNLWTIPVWSSDSSFIDYKMTNNVYFWYVMLKKRQKEIYDAQTGSAQPHIYPKNITVMPIIKLNDDKINLYTEKVTPLFERIGINVCENSKLQLIRDALLPKLMSGEIRVPLDINDK